MAFSLSEKASTMEPQPLYGTSSFSHSSRASSTPRTLSFAISEPGLGSYPACRMAELALVVPVATSFSRSSTATRSL